MRVMGDVHCAGVVRVAGTVIGNVSADSQVLVSQGGRVEGAVQAPEAVSNGNVIGPIVANRVEIQASAVIRGKITTSCFVIHEGAVLDVDVTKPVLADPVVHRDPLNPIQVMASSDEGESASVRQLQGGDNRAVREQRRKSAG